MPAFVHPIKLDISKTIPEIHHYTDWNGLQGIWNSKTLFATKYSNLNDASEIVHCKPLLATAVEARVKDFLRDWQKGSLSRRRHLERLGGVIGAAKGFTDTIIRALYLTSFSGSRVGPAFAIPYITSFCAFDDDRAYERENGLLSQWRGYGGSGRFAIIFETRGLEKLINEEATEYVYAFMELGKVTYNDANLDFTASYADLIDAAVEMSKTLNAALPSSPEFSSDAIGQLVPKFLRATCLIKHQGFIEEREIRIVAAPISEAHFDDMVRQGTDFHGGKTKLIETRDNSRGQTVEFIRLFRGKSLPVKRVLVGPQQNQEDAIARVRKLVGTSAEVTQSQTPFVG